MSSNVSFLSQQNKEILWEIIQDNEKKNPIQQEQLGLFFQNMVKSFYEREKDNHGTLMNMNKAFIITFFTVLNTHHNAKPSPQNASFQKLVTHEQLQEQRMSQFERDLERRKNEFDRSMTLSVPEAPQFKDASHDNLLIHEEMDLRVKQMAAAREMDMFSFHSGNKEEVERWLQPQETSVKVDKQNMLTKQNALPNPQEKVFIQITEEDMDHGLNAVDLKGVTWGKNQVQEFNHDAVSSSLVEERLKRLEEMNLDLSKQITALNQTLETYMEKCNNTLSVIYKNTTP